MRGIACRLVADYAIFLTDRFARGYRRRARLGSGICVVARERSVRTWDHVAME